MREKIEQVLDKYVRPRLYEHNGEIKIIDFEGSRLKVRLLGQCCNCPSAHITFKDIVEGEIKRHIPEIDEIVLVEGVSDEMIAFAKKILSSNRLQA